MSLEEVHLRQVLLTLVADHDGEYGWYQLARYPVHYGVTPQPPAMLVVEQLVSEGLLAASRSEDGPTRYVITPSGAGHLDELDQTYGVLPLLEQGLRKVPRDRRHT